MNAFAELQGLVFLLVYGSLFAAPLWWPIFRLVRVIFFRSAPPPPFVTAFYLIGFGIEVWSVYLVIAVANEAKVSGDPSGAGGIGFFLIFPVLLAWLFLALALVLDFIFIKSDASQPRDERRSVNKRMP